MNKKYSVCLLISAVLIGIDQLTKYLTVQHIELGEEQIVIPGILSFTYWRNTGGAWSMLQGKMTFFLIITVLVVAAVLYYLRKHINDDKWLLAGLVLVLGGALGNFLDRVRLGYVVDMIQTDFIQFPIFNVADMCLTIGAVCILIYAFRTDQK